MQSISDVCSILLERNIQCRGAPCEIGSNVVKKIKDGASYATACLPDNRCGSWLAAARWSSFADAKRMIGAFHLLINTDVVPSSAMLMTVENTGWRSRHYGHVTLLISMTTMLNQQPPFTTPISFHQVSITLFSRVRSCIVFQNL